jgi:hypothetical protein
MKIRLLLYSIIWVSYLLLMSNLAPLGIDWLPWHEARIINFVEFLRVNPYWDSLGFSVWNECMSEEDCPIVFSLLTDKIYLSKHSIVFLHFLFLNNFFGTESLILFGPLIDKIIIFTTAIACAELCILITQSVSKMPEFFTGIISFSLFAINPWTYKMLLSGWTEVYFLMFILLALISILKQYYKVSLLLFFIAGIYNSQWSLLIAVFLMAVLFLSYLNKERNVDFFATSPSSNSNVFSLYVIFSLLIPVGLFVGIRFFASSSFDEVLGSSLLSRIGITGNDLHNGGILGSLQFLGGNRISQCIEGIDLSFLSGDLRTKILVFNCLLSIAGMYFVSLISLAGFFLLLKKTDLSIILLPLFFALIAMVFILQQSLSIHLMGYSYIFSVFFAIGMTSLIIFLFQDIESNALKVTFIAPVFLGILILCIHISMLTGINS